MINKIVIFNNDDVTGPTTGLIIDKIKDFEIIKYDGYIKHVVITKYIVQHNDKDQDLNGIIYIIQPKDIQRIIN